MPPSPLVKSWKVIKHLLPNGDGTADDPPSDTLAVESSGDEGNP